MPIRPEPYKLVCPKCNYSNTVSPKSDSLGGTDIFRVCPKCNTLMKRREANAVEKLIGKLFRGR